MKKIGIDYTSWLILVVSSILIVGDASSPLQCDRPRVHPREINLLESLIQETHYLNSMIFIPGPNKKSPAVSLDGSRGICVDNTNYTFQRHLHEYSCSRKEFVIRACVKFDDVPDGPIFFLHSNDTTVLSLEVDATKNGSIKVSFVHEGGMRAISFPYTFTDLINWHNISVIFNGRLVSLYVDCNKVGDQIIMQPDYCLPEQLLLNIGDNPQHTETFKGCLQDLIISFKEKAIAKQCPKAHIDCRYSAAYQAINNSVSEMMEDHARLREEVEDLRQNVTMYQNMARRFACYVGGNQYNYQTFFYPDADKSKVCFCSEGGIPRCSKLSDIPMPPTEPFSDKHKPPCQVSGKTVPSGDLYNVVDENNECTSQPCVSDTYDGGITYLSDLSGLKIYNCSETPKDCTNAAKWTSIQREAAQCCKFCTACDMQTDCGRNTKCVDMGINYTCTCKDGYLREDGECTDINECNHGRHPEVGHYCPLDAECVNTDGSFTCKCPENHNFIDTGGHTSHCQDVDECLDPQACLAGFICTNTKGSYNCTCPTGYISNGDSCILHCDPPCKPGGQCVRSCNKTGGDCNNTCECPRGLHGSQCEKDVNECDRTDHGCSDKATCVNFHGSYFCRCNSGYRGNGRTCVDIDECAEQTSDCPMHSTCVNTEGNYNCSCPEGDCRGGCSFQQRAYPINGVRYRGQKNCTECRCINERWSCSNVQCDCSQHPISPCCGHCNKKTCIVEGEEYNHNEAFIHPSDPCQLCRCKNGNESCTDAGSSFKCPPELTVVTKDGCKQCKVEECTVENDGMEHDANNSCSICTCKNKEWTCIAKVQRCPEVSCEGNTVIMGCCPVCEGSDNRPPRNLQLISITSSEDGNKPC